MGFSQEGNQPSDRISGEQEDHCQTEIDEDAPDDIVLGQIK